MRYYKSENDDIPNTTEEWESNFNEDIFNDFEDDSIIMKNEFKEKETIYTNKNINILPECRFLCRATQILMELHLNDLM